MGMSSAILRHRHREANRICRLCGECFADHAEVPSGVSYIIICPTAQGDFPSLASGKMPVQGALPFDGEQLRLPFN